MSSQRVSALQKASKVAMIIASVVAVFVLVRAEATRILGPLRVQRISSSAMLESAGSALLGAGGSPVVYVFSDFQCPFCDGYRAVIDSVAKRGAEIRLVHNPLRIHARATDAARFSECAAKRGLFHEAHDALFDRQQLLDTITFAVIASEIGLDPQFEWQACREDPMIAARIAKDSAAVAKIGVAETPTIIVGEWRFLSPPSASDLADAITRVREGRRPRGADGFFTALLR